MWKKYLFRCNEVKDLKMEIRVGLNTIRYLYKRHVEESRDRGEGHVKLSQRLECCSHNPRKLRYANNCQRPDEARGNFPLKPPVRVLLCQHFTFRFMASRTMRKSICVVLSHSICISLLWNLKETNTWAI